MMPSGKFCSRQSKNPTKTTHCESLRAEFSLIRALISNRHIERIMGSYEKVFFFGGGGGGGGGRGEWYHHRHHHLYLKTR